MQLIGKTCGSFDRAPQVGCSDLLLEGSRLRVLALLLELGLIRGTIVRIARLACAVACEPIVTPSSRSDLSVCGPTAEPTVVEPLHDNSP